MISCSLSPSLSPPETQCNAEARDKGRKLPIPADPAGVPTQNSFANAEVAGVF
jgi:hypothetical protein